MKKVTFLIGISFALFSCGNFRSNDNATISNTIQSESNLTPPADFSTSEPNDEKSTVTTFINKLGNQDFEGAFALQSVSKWGNLQKFSSKSAFGGISSTLINEITQYPNEDNKSVIYAEVFYGDNSNGNNTFKQKFYLQKFGEKWKIVDMKVVNSAPLKIAGEYLCDVGDNLRKSITLEIISNTEYQFSIFSGNASGHTGELEGTINVENNKAHFSSDDCQSLDFTFTKNAVQITMGNCEAGITCSLGGKYIKK